MTKNYFYILLTIGFLFTCGIYAQDGKQNAKIQDASVIEGLNLYPNPVTNGKVFISSRSNAEKNIVIFDILGKKVLQTTIASKELSISNLSPGVYIIKIDENQATATRKLIIK